MKTSQIITNVVNNVKKLLDLGQAKILLRSRPIPKTMRYQIPETAAVYANYPASRQLTESKVEILYPLVLRMEMNITNATPQKGSQFIGYTTPTLWTTASDELVACKDGRHYRVLAHQLPTLLNPQEAHRLLVALKKQEEVQILHSYAAEIKAYIDVHH